MSTTTNGSLETTIRAIVRDELRQHARAQVSAEDVLRLIARRLGSGGAQRAGKSSATSPKARPRPPQPKPKPKPRAGSQRASLRAGILGLLRDSEAPIGSRAIANSLSKDADAYPFQGALKSLVKDGLVQMSGTRRQTVYNVTVDGGADGGA